MAVPTQTDLPFGAVRNSELFSSHWLDTRLTLEPEWSEQAEHADVALDALSRLWSTQRDRVARYRSEHALEQAFIQPVFVALGWKLFYQTHLRGREPDYALFDSDDSLQRAIEAGRTAPEFWRHSLVVADAKAWHIALDRPHIVRARREYPPEQIEWYMLHSENEFGILTNGRLWRLFSRTLDAEQPRFQTYLECDLKLLLDSWHEESNLISRDFIRNDFLRFFLLFGPAGHVSTDARAPLTSRAKRGSSEYRLGIGEDLRARVFEALRLTLDGFLHYEANGLTVDAVDRCRQTAFVFLYRILFVLYAEDRGLLPYRSNHFYTENRSLGRLRDDVGSRLDRVFFKNGEDYSHGSTSLWEDLQTLFDLIDGGGRRYDVTAYNGGLFDERQHPFLAEHAISDWYVARILDQLSRAEDPLRRNQGAFRVDYRDLRIQHLGSIYERLLEVRPRVSEVPVRNPLTGATIESGHVHLGLSEEHRTGGERQQQDRRTTGSFYTPDHIVQHIVERTLGPLCDKITQQLQQETDDLQAIRTESGGDRTLDAKLLSLGRDFDNRVLCLRVVDPSMGSGHFLLSACKYLAEEIATNPYTGHPDVDILGDESTLLYWKRQVVEQCLYGVDQNLLAVELAKLALWLETAAKDQSLTFLDHHLRVGNSLVGASVAELGSLPGTPLIRASVHEDVRSELPAFLEPLRDIARIPSDSPRQVKQKERLLGVAKGRAKPFLRLADVWCSSFYLDNAPTDEQYSEVVSVLRKPVVQSRLIQRREWFAAAVECAKHEDNRFFHWEFEFPEVYFNEAGRRGDPGFDAVIGNPPYDVLSELETGRDLRAFRTFINGHGPYTPTRRGKNNLYKLFICRAIELLAPGGFVGFICPMPLLGDDQAADVRGMLFRDTALNTLEVFPQKDDRNRRVFSEAKLSTAVFTARKADDETARTARFRLRVHSGNVIDAASPSLALSTHELEYYDPENLAVVSCDQADWDLVVRITTNPRSGRLRQFSEFFQGEVNETKEKRRGSLVAAGEGRLVVRGASICLYAHRSASQGTDLWLDIDRFLEGKRPNTKAYHYRWPRLALQESSPQNNFRRLIAATVPAGEFFNHTVNYTTPHHCRLSLDVLLGVLNSKVSDWYFRIGSTNAHVSHYQLYNLPCPLFDDKQVDSNEWRSCEEAFNRDDWEQLRELALVSTNRMAVGALARDVIGEAARRIRLIEVNRGDITRAQRSALAEQAQPLQEVIDHILFRLYGLTDDESAALEERLVHML